MDHFTTGVAFDIRTDISGVIRKRLSHFKTSSDSLAITAFDETKTKAGDYGLKTRQRAV